MNTNISIVVACRNERGHVRPFLDSLLSQELDGIAWEAVIADGTSNDGTREVLDEYSSRHPNLRVLSNPQRIVSTGLNAAIRAARGDLILRMDAHTVYAPTYCRRCVETLLSTGADNVGGPARTRAHGLAARSVAAAYHSRFSTGGARFHDPDYKGFVDTVPYGCWKKSTLEAIGLFDENLVRNQDDELNLRLLRVGGKIWQNPEIVSWYSPRSSLSSLFQQYFQYGFWKVAVIRKHRVPGSWRHLVPAAFALTNIVLLAAMILTASLNSVSALSLAASVWFTMILAYAGISLVASLLAARRYGWDTLPYLPIVFFVYHLSYGCGFIGGLFRFLSKRQNTFASDSVYARVTR